MLTLSTLAQETIRKSHGMTVRGTATSPGFGTLTNLPITGGTVTDDATSQVRRTGSVYIADPTLWPAHPTDVLSPLGAELFVEQGIAVPGRGIEWVPLITALITDVSETLPFSTQGLAVSLADRSQAIHDDQLAIPLQVGGTGTVINQIRSLITRTWPTANIIDQTGDTTTCPYYTVQQDPWTDGIEKLADAIGAEVFCDPLGNWIIRYQPTLSAASSPSWLVNTGANGILVNNTRVKSRSTVYNVVIATGQSSSGASPVFASVQDNDPTSPTYVGGPMGRKTLNFTSPLLLTVPQCTSAATALLARVKGADTTVTLGAVANPGLQSGDILQLAGSAGSSLHIVDTVTHSLDFTQPQRIVGRSTELPLTDLEGILP